MKPGLTLFACFALASFATREANATSCLFNSVTAVDFTGTPYNPFSGSNVDGVGGFTFTCSLFSAFDTVTINLGTGSSMSYSARTLVSGVNTLNYQLYTDAGRTQVWGDKSSGTTNYSSLLNVLPIPIFIYGRIPSGQNAKFGSYTDTVVITMLF